MPGDDWKRSAACPEWHRCSAPLCPLDEAIDARIALPEDPPCGLSWSEVVRLRQATGLPATSREALVQTVLNLGGRVGRAWRENSCPQDGSYRVGRHASLGNSGSAGAVLRERRSHEYD